MKHTLTTIVLITTLVFGLACSGSVLFDKTGSEVYAAKKTYKVSPKSKASTKYCNSNLYNSKTRQYFAIREKLEKLEKTGGKLVFKKGTYTISNALYVPSNVTIVLNNGVTINHGKSTGVKGWKASKSLFQLIKPSKSKKKNVYGKYNGSKNITFVGKGKAVINLKYYKNYHGILACHNKNVTIKNITFKNMNNGHFIEMDANKGAVIGNCKFINSKGSIVKEAINLDTPDKKTGGWDQAWSKFDKTPNKNVTIKNCTFKNLGHAVGTHKYSENKPHTSIKILNNSMIDMKQEGVRMMNWTSPVIKENTITGKGSKAVQGIIGRGVKSPVIEKNAISNFKDYVIYIKHGKNNGAGSSYKTVWSSLSNENFESLKTNTYSNMTDQILVKHGKDNANTWTWNLGGNNE